MIQDNNPDIVLMDIRMPHMDGLEAASYLAELNTPPALIFTTAYDEYAVRAFDTKAVAYLLKPVRSEHLVNAIDSARSLNRAQLSALHQSGEDSKNGIRNHLCAKLGNRLELIPVDQVYYFMAEQKYVTVRHLAGEVVIEESLKTLENEFGDRVLRIHRNALVALRHVAGMEKTGEGRYQIAFKNIDERLEVSRRLVAGVRQRIRSL